MENIKYSWNKKSCFFKDENNHWVLYSGETGIFLNLSENEKQQINLFTSNKKDLPTDLAEKLRIAGAISNSHNFKFKNAKNFRLLKTQISHIFTISICPYDFTSGTTISESLIKKIVKFCELKNQRIIRVIWNSNDENKVKMYSSFLNKELSKVNIICYNALVSNFYNYREKDLIRFKNLKFNNFKFLITSEIILDSIKFQSFLDKLEIMFNYYKHVFYIPIIKLIFELNEQTQDKFSFINDFISQRYGDFFQLNYSFYTNIYDCPNKIDSEVYENSYEIDNYLKFDESIKNYKRPYLKKIADTFLCYAQYVSSYIIDWNGNVLKCWNDLGKEEKAIYNLKTKMKKNHEIEYQYLMNDSTNNCKQCYLNNQCNGGCINFNKASCSMKKYLDKFYRLKIKEQKYFEI